ncbi:hypothetical protein E1I69_15685 [Bacillus timonensis]|uniref:Glycerophosphoryl diester phosphodiesterase membrane domain-containing protein n=1 Tax=Bacillus timonensis TaxID=1033734 RepID=A0A4S3PQ23_9BACI|nr:hypothetical protein [Bacillus timonensis]THE11295.1 hypothetical protein E1I69_15685 [Bacillus timonensis]
MNISKGLYHTIYHPRLIIIPLIVNVFLTFIGTIASYAGFSILYFSNSYAAPFGIPFLDDVIFPFQGLIANWLLTSIAIIVILLLKSYALSTYLGSMKCFLVGPDNTYSILKIAPYYFDRMVRFSIIEFCISGILLTFSTVFWPLALLGILIVLFYSLTPYIIVLEDTTVRNAIARSPKLFIKNFGTLFLIALVSLIFRFLIKEIPFPDTKMEYYVVSLLYSFIGTILIFAVMNCLHKSIYTFILPSKKVIKSRKLFLPLWIVALLLPLLGAMLIVD